MTRILFVMLHPGFIRYYEDALLHLAAAGHRIHLAFETGREKLGSHALAARLAAASPLVTCGPAPPRSASVREFLARRDREAMRSGEGRRPARVEERREEAWESLATTIRLMLDYLRYFEPAFARAAALRDRAAKRLPHIPAAAVRLAAALGPSARRALSFCLRAIEEAIPASRAIEEFVREHRPDLLLVTPLVELGSQQVDYIKCARRLGIRSALCVASWDNLTSKGLIRVIPDHVVVWNEAQKAEAVTMHGVAPDRVVITGAQLFDRWFDASPTRSREEFCRAVGLDPDRPFVLYVGSSVFVAPDEVPFAERWLARIRRSGDPVVASAGVLVRPHPANARQWLAFDVGRWPNVAIWPPIDSDPNGPDVHRDFFESLYYSAAVVGVNTSAQLEAGIVGRPVFTIRAPEFEHAQEGTLHFNYLVSSDAGPVQQAATLDEHVEQLGVALRGGKSAAEANRPFVRAFIRPFGESVAAAPVFVRAIASLAALAAPPPRRPSIAAVAARPALYLAARLARALAEDRPLWVYAARPFITTGVRVVAPLYWMREAGTERLRDGVKRLKRQARRARHASGEAIERRWRRARRRARRALAAATGAFRKAL